MATFKHISSKNANYGDAERYLTFRHDEFTMKPILDENGRLIPREDYRISTFHCGEEDFAIACMRANLKYGKNQRKEDVKSHHYIISFDPRDGPDHGLTIDRAQALGEGFCREHFPGHQAIVCTHPDGHSGTGNIHVHIVINSLRIKEVSFLPYMDRPADTKEGCKHRCTDAAMEYFRAEVMEMCHREELYQIDLLHGSANRVTEREYWAKKKGQAAIDAENRERKAGGQPQIHTKYETDKEKLRRTIRAALARASGFEEFAELLLREGITVKESRGRLSYLTPERAKPITARKLGDDFDKTAVFARVEENAKRKREEHHVKDKNDKMKRPISVQERLERENVLQRLVDIEAKKAEGKGIGYQKWAGIHNLKQMSKSLSIYTEYGFRSPEEVAAAAKQASAELSEVTAKIKAVEREIAGKKELQRHILDYAKGKPVLEMWKKQKNEKARKKFKESHASDFILLDAAKRYFDERGLKTLPSSKRLQGEIEKLIKEKNELYNKYQERKASHRELLILRQNIEQILNEAPLQRKVREETRG